MSRTLITSILIASAICLSGCSTAGPFVTNISSDGRGGLTYEKCMVQLNSFTNNISNKDCTQTNIQLFQTDMKEDMK